jgi:hypothetical protein
VRPTGRRSRKRATARDRTPHEAAHSRGRRLHRLELRAAPPRGTSRGHGPRARQADLCGPPREPRGAA